MLPDPTTVASALSPVESVHHIGFENFDVQLLWVMLARLLTASLLGALVAFRPWRRFLVGARFATAESASQVLIAAAGALLTVVIGTNVALAFGLVGLGGFIRFRSGIKDPREAGVMFFMIGIGMACGHGMMPIAVTAAAFAIGLLFALDLADARRKKPRTQRVKVTSATTPTKTERALRKLLAERHTITRARIRRQDVELEVAGGAELTAGELIEALEAQGLEAVEAVVEISA